MKITCLKIVPHKGDMDKNIELFKKHADEAGKIDTDLFVTCECFLDGYIAPDISFNREKLFTYAQDVDNSNYIDIVKQKAKKNNMHIIFGFSRKNNDRLTNATALVSNKGEIIGIYEKNQLLDHDLQYDFGKGFPVFETELGKMGMIICADRRWPESVRCLKINGADIVINPTYGFYGEFNQAMMRTRAYENEIYLAFVHPKESMIINPKGHVIGYCDDDNTPLYSMDINFDIQLSAMFDARRPEIYSEITKA